MKRLKADYSRGWSLVELMVVLGVMAVLLTIMAPRFAAYLVQGQRAQCIANRYTIEREVYLRYTGLEPPAPPPEAERARSLAYMPANLINSFIKAFPASAVATDSEESYGGDLRCPLGGVYVVQDLPDSGNEVPVRVICSVHGDLRAQEPITSDSGSGYTPPSEGPEPGETEGESDLATWDFQKMSAEDLAGLRKTSDTAWSLIGEEMSRHLEGDKGDQRIFMENGLDEYRITVKGRVDSEKLSGVGYGILIDTDVNKNHTDKDTGRIVQFDKGYGGGEIVLRDRTNGKEASPFARFTTGYSDDSDDPDYDPFWWNAEHVMELVVTRLDKKTKQVEIFIDGVSISGGNPARYESKEKDGGYVGLRVWGGPSSFRSLSIAPV